MVVRNLHSKSSTKTKNASLFNRIINAFLDYKDVKSAEKLLLKNEQPIPWDEVQKRAGL